MFDTRVYSAIRRGMFFVTPCARHSFECQTLYHTLQNAANDIQNRRMDIFGPFVKEECDHMAHGTAKQNRQLFSNLSHSKGLFSQADRQTDRHCVCILRAQCTNRLCAFYCAGITN